jgi:uncharacterized protein YunC (DUF1805 family)
MRSLLVEFHRFNDLDSGSWRVGDPYLVAAAAHRVREFRMTIGQDEFLDLVAELRYQGGAEARVAALNRVGKIATEFLGTASLDDMQSGSFPLQLDLVVNPAELAALQFEAATDSEGRPLFARGEQPVILTRRVRHEFADTSPRWPARPRILYAWAAPPGVGEVPAPDHEQALRDAIEPWTDPPEDGAGEQDDAVLTVLPQVSLAALEQTCRAAVRDAKPFTHVHLLAHGYPVGHAHRQRFGMAFHSETGDLAEVTPEQVEDALKPLVGHAVVVTLATCDAANLTNTTTSQRSIAHNLHVLGFPIVVASQLPLTKAGSTLVVSTFYGALLAGADVRVALHETRLAYYQTQQQTGHDWASLVAYARLPEGYADHLLDVRLGAVLAALKTIQGRADRLVAGEGRDPARFDQVATLVQARIARLEAFLNESGQTGRRGVLEENLGLLGTAEKRLGELCFVRSQLGESDKWRHTMREALVRSRGWYLKASEHNLSHHWTAAQYLSLEAALTGSIANCGLWHAAVTAAQIDRRRPTPMDVIWALGSLLELYLLAPLAGQNPHTEEAKAVWAEMRQAVAAMDQPDAFPLESTQRQLRRYVSWWSTANGFFPGRSDLAAEAASLLGA